MGGTHQHGTGGTADHWLSARRDRETGVEAVRAHFKGHAYDPHDHDDVLVGVTEQGLQRFRCRRELHTSTPGTVILMEPGEVHDGHAPSPDGFTYTMLYLPQAWLAGRLDRLAEGCPAPPGLGFRRTLDQDAGLADSILAAFTALQGAEGRLARDLALDGLVGRLAGMARHPPQAGPAPVAPDVARARDLLHARMAEDVGMDELAAAAGTDRFRLNRRFRQALGLSPHAYLVRLRLRAARGLLATGMAPAAVAAEVGFADQSHLGRWFRRAYRMTPAAYRRMCTGVPD